MNYEKRPWSREERHVLKKHYGIIPLQELLVLLPGRTETSIYSQVHYLRKRGWTFGK